MRTVTSGAHPLFWAHSLDELLSFIAETRE